MKKFIIFLIIIIGLYQSCYMEEISFNPLNDDDYKLTLMLKFDHQACSYDHRNNTLRYSLPNNSRSEYTPYVEFQKCSSVSYNGIELQNKNNNNLGDIEYNKNYEIVLRANGQTKVLNLMFTDLPIIQIITPNRIVNEPKVPAVMKIISPEENNTVEHVVGIKYRGRTTLALPKKSMGFSLRNPTNYNQNISNSILDLRINNDWILDAVYKDKSNSRSTVSYKVWEEITQQSKLSIHSQFVELFINNEHQGLYCLREKYNGEFFSLSNYNSVLYKSISFYAGATTFDTYLENESLTSEWNGWEHIYPDPERELNWGPLQNLSYVIVVSDSSHFCSNISSTINISEYIDFYIFLYVSSADDCIGKNTILLKEHEGKFQFIPWDLDPTWGLYWDGSRIDHCHLFSDRLFDKLMALNPDNFRARLKSRWFELRAETLTEENIKTLFINNFSFLNNSNIIDIDNDIWGTQINLSDEQEFIFYWTKNRLTFLDNYFNNL